MYYILFEFMIQYDVKYLFFSILAGTQLILKKYANTRITDTYMGIRQIFIQRIK